MKALSLTMLAAAAVLVLPVAAHAQLSPQMQTGSMIPVQPKTVGPVRSGQIRKGFAQCVYRRSKAKADALLASSDSQTVDLAKAKITKVVTELNMEACLGGEVAVDQDGLGMNLPNARLRDLLAEEAYLARNRTAPTLPAPPAPAPALDVTLVSTGPLLQRAQTMVTFTDCAVRRDVAHADALLRTMPGSPKEHDAAMALAPALGACMVQGDKIAMTAANIRAFIAFAMWTRFGQGAAR